MLEEEEGRLVGEWVEDGVKERKRKKNNNNK